MHYNIFSLQRTLYLFIPTQHWISGSGADPFAALVIFTPVSNFILNSETTGSYLFILLKVSIETNLQLLKFSNFVFIFCYTPRTVPYDKTTSFPCAVASVRAWFCARVHGCVRVRVAYSLYDIFSVHNILISVRYQAAIHHNIRKCV